MEAPAVKYSLCWIVCALAGLGMGAVLLPGQERAPAPPSGEAVSVTSPALNLPKNRDISKFSLLQRHFYLSAHRGTSWLVRANRPDGRFVFGYAPALRQLLDGDHYLRQAAAAGTLARAARFFADDRAAAVARQALLTLLLETREDAKNQVRRTLAPPGLVNPEAAAGVLLSAIYALPDPGKDLLDQAEELANFLRTRLQADGSLLLDTGTPGGPDFESVRHFSGHALVGLASNLETQATSWKLQALVKARPYYHDFWQKNKNVIMLPQHTCAYAEAFLRTKDPALAQAVFDMNDWLCTLQYQQMDPRRSSWSGGFMPYVDGKAIASAPDVYSAPLAESLADACRVARQAGDAPRFQRYRQALESALQFLTTLQYTEAGVQHFADWYRPVLVGAYHASPLDGNVRLDFTQLTVAALVQYLEHVADLP